MNHSVLLADDSITIQKVIKITLANQPYDLTEASNEEELFKKLSQIKPRLVLLDFNLSEKYTGYELTTKIKELCPDSKVLMLLGTFDTVEEALMDKCGASDKIVKPFDSNKFIAICRQLIDSFDQAEIPYPQKKNETIVASSIEDQWTLTHSNEQKLTVPVTNQEKTLPEIKGPLAKEINDWGMSVPGIISHSNNDKHIELPPVIGGGNISSLSSHKDQKMDNSSIKREPLFPTSDDLDYPTIEEKNPPKSSLAPSPIMTSKVISIDSLNDPGELEMQTYFEEESNVKMIEEQIQDEIKDNLWQADEFEDLKREVSSKIDEVKFGFQPSRSDFDESLFRPHDDSASITWNESEEIFPSKAEPLTVPSEPVFQGPSVDRREIEEMVKVYVKQYLDELFLNKAEKVAWEVIPDLAENLIKQELSKISEKIIKNHT